MDKKTEEYTLEENFARLRETIEQLEDENISVEEAFGAYSAGMAILKQCNDQIDKVEKQIMVLSEEGMEEYES